MIKKVIEIDVDELQAIGGLNNLNKAVQETDKQTASLKTQIREATAELVKAQQEFGDYSTAALDAAKKVAILKDKVQEAKETAELFDPAKRFQAATGVISAGANAIQGYQAALGLVGVEGEAAQEALLKVQSAMALSQSLSGLKDAQESFQRLGAIAQKYTIVQKAITAGQWLWNAAMAANPIGAIVAVVVALIAAGVALTKYFMDNSAAAEANAKAVENNRKALESQDKQLERNSEQFDKNQKHQLAMAKASGASAEAIRKLELKLIDEKIAYEKSERAIRENTYQKELNYLASLKAAGADEEQIKKQTQTASDAIKQYNKQNQDVQKALDEKKDIQRRHLEEIKTAETSSAKETAQKRKEAQDKARQELKDQQKKDLEEIKKIQGEAVKANSDMLLTDRERELNDLKIKNDAKLALLEKYGKSTAALKIQIANEENDIELKYQKIKDDQLKEQKDKDDKALEEKRVKDAEDRANQLALKKEFDLLSFEDQRLVLADRERILLEDKTLSEEQKTKLEEEYSNARKTIAEKEREVKQKNLEAASNALSMASDILGESTSAGKAAAVAAATISTYAAIAGQLQAFSKVPIPGYAIAQAVMTGVQGFMSVKKILSVKTPKGGGGSSGGGGSMTLPSAGGAGGGGATAPSFNVVGNSGVNQIQQTLGMQQQQPIQAYVVANNVTTAQSLDRNIIRNASLG